MHIINLRKLADLNQCGLIWRVVEGKIAPQVARIDHRAIVGRNDRHDNAPSARGNRVIDWLRRRILLKKSDPGVGIIRLRVGARGVEHALDCVCGAGDVVPAFDVCECWSKQHQQEADDADDDQQLEQRKTPKAFGVTLRGQRKRAGALTLRSAKIFLPANHANRRESRKSFVLAAVRDLFPIRVHRVAALQLYAVHSRLPRRSCAKAGDSRATGSARRIFL